MFRRRLVIPTVIQTSPAESGAAALASVAGALGHHAPLSEVAALCAPTNRSCRIEDILHASEVLGLRAEARHLQHHDFGRLRRPALLDCGTGRFLVLAGRNLWPGRFRVMDPAEGMRTVDADELRRCCTGRVMELAPGESFRYQGRSRSLTGDILLRLPVMAPALVLAALAGLLLIVPGVAQPGFTKIFIDNILSPERRDWLRPLLLAMAVSLVIIWALGGLQRRVLLRQILKSGITGGAEFITRALRLPFSFFTRFHGGEVAMRGQYIENVSQIIAEDLTATVTNLVAIALYALVMYLYDPA
ncbi:MAG: hypothetical protein EOM25_14255, partial [Deltaproteobacteria bacterium]|nr:hypothetical protein [Deltaproteobacteria bacterium]